VIACVLLSLYLLSAQGTALPPENNPMELSPEMQAFLDKRVDRRLEAMQRLESLVSAVFHDNDLNFIYSGDTRTAIETFTSRNGNCLSFTLLFITMARYLNLDARFREVEIIPNWSKSGVFVNLNQHINAAVFIGGHAYAIDVFPAVNRIEIGGQVVPDARGLAHFFNNKGVEELGRGNYPEAESYLKKALEHDPTTVPVWINLGAAQSHAGRAAEAEKSYRRALEIDPRNMAAMSNLANLFETMGKVKEAIRLQMKVRVFREKNPYHHYNLGLQAFEDGRYEESLAEFKKALKLKPGEHNFYFAMARVYGQLGQADDAVNSLQQAMKYASDPSNKARYNQKLELLRGIRTQSLIALKLSQS
jgi:tetratricopeptide (TPR) repeat protein